MPVVEEGVLAHYLRIGDQTLRINPYLHADLVLGRRRAPELTLTAEVIGSSSWASQSPTLDIKFRFENSGLVWVPQLQILLAAYVRKPRQLEHPQFIPTSDAIERELEVRPMGPHLGAEVELQMLAHELMPNEALPPLQWGGWRHQVPFAVDPDPATWLGAACLLPSNGLPQWWQLSISLARTPGRQLETGVPICQRVPAGTQPQIAYGSLDELDEWLR